jgi:hypothetical protein
MKSALLLLATMCGIVTAHAQQIIEMEESDVEMKVQTWHYSQYPKSKEVTWILKVKDGEGVYEASFVFNGDEVLTAYTDDGFILWEEVSIAEKNIPDIVIGLLDYRIVKYKIDSFIKHTTFDEVRKPIEEEYKIVAYTKTGGEVVYWFDQDFNLIPEKKISGVANR